ncbi:FHA domain-containing protein [Tersicoccus sp. Bi-70]|uniref:FHA domain-containing protein n=1 Tax=Tersicoccus sp. Bi-70 TaxID=1897634 RepID=UPI0009777DBB|nr:FHA domain-containing protein [Tersicoccus sp. Bi-70]OMH31319.1 hypothetical protein BGP79_09850 [Tersicoccus sp. Bi-70]
MTAARYRSGDWTLLAQLPPADADADAGAVVLLPPGTPAETIDRVWDALAVDSGTGGLPVGDPTSIGAFAGAVLGAADGIVLRVAGRTVTPAVRGAGSVTVLTDGGDGERRFVDGDDSAVVADVRSVTVLTGPLAPRADDGAAVWLPLRAGIVTAAELRFAPAPAPAQAPAQPPAPATPSVDAAAEPASAVIPPAPSNAPTIGAVRAADEQPAAEPPISEQPATALPAAEQPAEQPTDRPTTGPLVLARVCPEGHANPPATRDCGRCGRALTGDPRRVPRPSLGTLTVSDGRRLELDRPLVVGRQPAVTRGAGADMPRIVTVPSPHGDISRSHVRVRLDGWHVLLDDLESTNGTLLRRPGQPPRRLGRGESTMLLDGDAIDLGDGIGLTFEARP